MRRITPIGLIIASLLLGCSTPRPPQTPPASDKAAAPSLTLPPSNGKPVDVQGISELVGTFLGLCLNVFPDDEAVAAKVETEGHAPLSDQQLRLFLHDDPGRGWLVRRGDMTLVLTVELPPFHSCTVRGMLPTEPDIAMSAALAAGTWGLNQTPVETLALVTPRSLAGDGMTQTVYRFAMLGPDKQPIELVGAYLTRFSDGEAVEVRLVRMRGNNPR